MRRSRGFTLIELMVVVAIIAILSAIALPSYSDYITRGKITEAVAGLSDIRVRMEQYFQDNRSYVSAGTTCGAALPGDTSNFAFTCSGAADTYTATATGASTSSMNGFVYTVDQSNARQTTRAISGWATSTTCWVLKRDGSC